jgi:serine/threonine protein kinase
MALMSRLLDEALPLDLAGRRVWLDTLSPEYGEISQYLRDALLPGDSSAAKLESLATLPKLGAAAPDGSVIARGLQSGARVGPYELIRLLGAGGMAEVWLARRADGAFNREVALKLPMLTNLRADLEQRFARERDILASLEHPLIARLYDAGIDPAGLPYLSMEYVPGRPLTDWCDAHRLEIAARVALFLQVVEAVQYAHEREVVHRDIKPSNVLVTEAGQVRLLDFGVAQLLEADAQATQLTNVYGRAVTPDYASPELLRGEPIDVRSDVYSLGVLLYEVLTGVRPYRLKNAASIGMLEQAVTTVEVKNPSTQDPNASAARATTPEKFTRQLRGDLDAIALKALAKEPAKRYPSAAALAQDLRHHLDGKLVGALPARFTDRLRKFVQRNRAVLGATLTTVVAMLVAVGFLLWGPLHPASEIWRDPLAETKFTRLTDSGGSEQAAAISRDGRYAAFLADRDGHLDAWLTEIGSNGYRNLTNGQLQDLSNSAVRTVAFSPDARFVTLWTRKGDGSRPDDVNVVGAPTAGGALQPYLPEIAEFDWSADGTRLVFHPTAPGDPLFVRAKGEATARLIYVAPSGVHCHFPTWSPDGEYIYFVRGVPSAGVWDLWRLRPSGEGLERLSFHNSRVTYPVLLDARTLIYLATDADGSGPWLYAMDVPQRRTHRVSFGLERYTSLAASANRRRLVATVADVRSDLWRVRIGGDGPPPTTAVRVAPAIQNAFAPRFGPDYIAFASTGGARRGIWKLVNGTATELWSDARADRVGPPAIAPDGRRVAFTVDRHDTTQLYVIDSDGTHAQVVATTLALRGDLAWTPDSQSILGSIVRDGEPRLAKIFLDGSPPQPLASEYSVDPVWSPDGRYFVYSGADVGTTFPLRAAAPDGRPYGIPSLILTRGAHQAFSRNLGLLVILRGEYTHKNFWAWDPKTGAERQLTDLPSSFVIGDFDVSPDGTEILFDREQESSSLALIERTR